MKTTKPILRFTLLFAMSSLVQADPLGTAFTYQGQLTDGGQPANGSYDLKFTLHDAASGGNAVAGPITNVVSVTDGLFTVPLDFGPGVFTGNARWLEIGVRSNGSSTDFTLLSPLQELTPTPYALYAAAAPVADGAVSSAQILDGNVSAADLADNSVTSNKIADLNVTTADLADNSVVSAKILDGTVTDSDLASDAVNTAKIQDGTITGADLANNTVTSAQLGDDVELGSTSANGELTLWSDANNLESVRLYGATHSVSILDNSGDQTVSLNGGGAAGGALTLWGPDGTLRANLNGSGSGANVLLRDSTATATVQLRGDLGGEIDVAERLNVKSALGGTTLAQLEKHGGGAWLRTYDEAGLLSGYFGSSGGAGGFAELYTSAGNLGLRLDGDNNGAGLVVVNATNGTERVRLIGQGSGGGGEIRLANTNASTRLSFFGQGTNSAGELNVFDASGTETIEVLGQQSATLGSRITLRQSSGTASLTLNGEYGAAGEGSAIILNNGAGLQRLRIEGDESDAGYLAVYKTNGSSSITLDGYSATGSGRVTTDELQITSPGTVWLTNGATLTPTSSYVRVIGDPGIVTLSASTAIANGTAVGLILVLEGTSVPQPVTIPDNANTRLGADRWLTRDSTLTLIWNGSDWLELSYSQN